MLIPRWLIAMMITSITIIYSSKYVFEYMENKQTNDTIKIVECWKQNIKQDICDKLLGAK